MYYEQRTLMQYHQTKISANVHYIPNLPNIHTICMILYDCYMHMPGNIDNVYIFHKCRSVIKINYIQPGGS